MLTKVLFYSIRKNLQNFHYLTTASIIQVNNTPLLSVRLIERQTSSRSDHLKKHIKQLKENFLQSSHNLRFAHGFTNTITTAWLTYSSSKVLQPYYHHHHYDYEWLYERLKLMEKYSSKQLTWLYASTHRTKYFYYLSPHIHNLYRWL